MQDVIQACLTTFAGWNVRVANSNLEGVQQAILSQPEAIIVEVSVGEIDGLRFLKQLRTPPATQGIPVAILTYAASWGGEHLIFVKTLVLAPSFFLFSPGSWLLAPNSNF